ncbi:MAG: sulfur carrier protein ThiS [Holophagales bacterium]|nr:sulfur carrier protein ThiS [Holophagales bacterium]MXX60429.1 sulfur carrier protein ThiS [Holophagales bacterium]MYC10080.1 sulfur carrier protein ThiS [Holophagales bacterium]MYD21386.1 sulfur carrier protein ThiS [Holophagales bacterium]MYI32640.1 sulfur carrier protein ThiS [Holophagales bacterium]
MASLLRLEVNGQERELPVPGTDASVLDLLASLDQHPKTVAVEVNRELVPRARFGDTSLHDGDRVEIVRFVQGG